MISTDGLVVLRRVQSGQAVTGFWIGLGTTYPSSREKPAWWRRKALKTWMEEDARIRLGEVIEPAADECPGYKRRRAAVSTDAGAIAVYGTVSWTADGDWKRAATHAVLGYQETIVAVTHLSSERRPNEGDVLSITGFRINWL